ncbi:unnamed protein product, partial [Brenthis ino]
MMLFLLKILNIFLLSVMDKEDKDKVLLPHHVQQSLCTTRLPYRQGRKLTAVKVYSIAKESNHLLIFGVPSLKLRQETKAQFAKFGKLLQFNISKEHAAEVFTETYHAQYEKIQSARLAKRMLDTKNFYGGSLHVTYAPEMENVEETRHKLIQRQQNIIYRLKNLQKEKKIEKQLPVVINDRVETLKMNMGQTNTIIIGPQVVYKKKKTDNLTNKKIKLKDKTEETDTLNISNQNIEVIDCTDVQNDVISNIDEALNYNKFGNEVVKKVPIKPINKIQFHINKKS